MSPQTIEWLESRYPDMAGKFAADSFTLEKDSLKRLAQAAEAFCAGQLERGFSTLNFYKSLCLDAE